MSNNVKYISVIALILLVFCIKSNAQIYPGLGIIPIDSILFDDKRDHDLLRNYGQTSCNLWQVGIPSKTVFNSAFTPPIAIITDSINTYGKEADNYFDLLIPAQEIISPVISFRHRFETDLVSEGCWIEISNDNGLTFRNLVYDTLSSYNYVFGVSGLENIYNKEDTITGGIPAFSGSSNGWVHSTIQKICDLPLKQMCGQDTMILRFRFRSDSIETFKDGWMIDNIVIAYTDLPGAVEEINDEEIKVKLYPNPADERIFFDIDSPNYCNIEQYIITNSQGFNILMGKTDESIYIGHLEAGYYQVHLFMNTGEKITSPFIKR